MEDVCCLLSHQQYDADQLNTKFNHAKSDSSIYKIVICGFLLSLLFSSLSLDYYYLFGSIVSGSHISPHKGFIRVCCCLESV